MGNSTVELPIERRVEEAEQAYRLIGELIPYGTWTAELDGSVTYLSESFVEMTGRSSDELLGWGWIDLLETDEERKHEVEAWRLLGDSGSDMRDTKHRVRSHNGTYRSIMCRGVRLHDEHGNPVKWAGIHVDITESERRLQFRGALAAVKDLLVTTGGTNRLPAEVGEAVLAPASADYAAVIAPTREGWYVRHVVGAHGWPSSHRAFPRDQMPLGAQAFETGKIAIAADARECERASRDWARHDGLQSLVILPVTRKGRPGCLLALAYTRRPIVSDGPLMDFFSDLLDSLDLALQATSVHEHQRHVAETLQEGLLTMPAHLPGIRMAHLYQPATAGDRVGGDFYDAFEVGERVAFMIGDVSGSGIEAAAVTALVKNSLRAHLIDWQSPATALSKTNAVVYKFTEAHEFATVFVGILDPATGEMRCASAGHPDPIRTDRAATQLISGSDLLLGAFPEARYEEHACRLHDDEVLFLYTDGITEARRDDELFGESRLLALLDSIHERDPGVLVQRVFAAVKSYAGGAIDDDVAVLAVQRDRDPAD